jgi:hypothetical protein
MYTPASSVTPRATCRRVDLTSPDDAPPGPADADAEGLPLFCQQLLQDLQLQIALGHQLFQPRLLTLQMPQPHRLSHLKRTISAAPAVKRLLGNAVPSADISDLLPRDLRFAQNPDDLLFCKPLLGQLAISFANLPRCLTLYRVRNLGSRSVLALFKNLHNSCFE